MYVCNCNGVKSGAVIAAIDRVLEAGAPSVDAVYAACGVTPKCGRCRCDIARLIDAALPAETGLAAE